MITINHDAPTISEALGIDKDRLFFFIETMIENFKDIMKSQKSFVEWISDDDIILKIGAIVNLAVGVKRFIMDKDENKITVGEMVLSSYIKCLTDIFDKPSEVIEYLYNKFPRSSEFLFGLTMACLLYISSHCEEINCSEDNKILQ